MNELQVTSIKVDYELPTLTYDLTPLKTQIENIKKQYKNWVVVEEDLKTAKDIVASINKVAKSISDERIVVAKEIKEPITKFEDDLKYMTADLKQLSDSIKDQLNDFEEQRKEKKKQEILALPEYDKEYMFFDEKWLNKTCSITDIQNDLNCQRMSFNKNKAILLSVISDTIEVSKYVDHLKKTLDLEATIQLYKNDMVVREKTLSELGVNAVESDNIKPQEIFKASGIKYMRLLKINATKEQIALLKEFLTKYEINMRWNKMFVGYLKGIELITGETYLFRGKKVILKEFRKIENWYGFKIIEYWFQYYGSLIMFKVSEEELMKNDFRRYEDLNCTGLTAKDVLHSLTYTLSYQEETFMNQRHLPRKVIFNDKKKATTLLYGDEATVVKACKGDKYDKEKGFLMAFFQKQTGLSKTQAKKYLKKITEEKE